MLCDKCGIKEASYHNSLVVNGVVVDEHLCASCNGHSKASYFNPIITGHCCKTCGCTFEEFSTSGLLGCTDCYNSFREELSSIINKLQGSSNHYGKSNARGLTEEEKEYMELTKQLKQAISQEDFELAGALKEQILKLRNN